MCARRAPGKLLIVRLETSISGQRLSIAYPAAHAYGNDAADYQSRSARIEVRSPERGCGQRPMSPLERNKKANVVLRLLQRRGYADSCIARPDAAFTLDRSLQIKFESTVVDR